MPQTTTRRGRRPDASSKSSQVRELLKTGMTAAEIAKRVGCTTGLVYVIKSKSGTAAKRRPGRPRKATGSPSADGLDGILAAVKDSQRNRAAMLAALEKIQSVIAAVLA